MVLVKKIIRSLVVCSTMISSSFVVAHPVAPTSLELLQEAGQNFGVGALAFGQGLAHLTNATSYAFAKAGDGFKMAAVQYPRISAAVTATCLAGAALKMYYADGNAKLNEVEYYVKRHFIEKNEEGKDLHPSKSLYQRELPTSDSDADIQNWIKKLYGECALYKAEPDLKVKGAAEKNDAIRTKLLQKILMEKQYLQILQDKARAVVSRYNWCPSIWGVQSIFYPAKGRAVNVCQDLNMVQEKLDRIESLVNKHRIS